MAPCHFFSNILIYAAQRRSRLYLWLYRGRMHGGSGRGFTLIETLIYIAVLSLTATLVVEALLPLLISFSKASVIRSTDAQGSFAMERLIREIRLANDIVPATTIFNGNPGQITLQTVVSPQNPTATTRRFFIDNGILMLQEGTSPAVALTSSDITITNFMLRNILKAPTKGLVGYWPFDEGSGTQTNDRSGSQASGTLINMDPATDWVNGKIAKALEFDGGNDYVSVPGTGPLNITGNITVALWVKPLVNSSSFHSSWNFFIYQRNPLKYEIGFYNTGGPRFKPYNQTGADFDFSANTPLTADTWYHTAMVRNGSFLGIYINGALANSRNDFSGALRLSDEIRIGGNGGSSGFLGAIDDVRIYDRALSDAEITQLAKATKPKTVLIELGVESGIDKLHTTKTFRGAAELRGGY